MDKRRRHSGVCGVRACLLMVFLCPGIVCVATAESFRERIEYGNALLNSGDFDGAREVYRGLQVEHPEDETVYYSLGCVDYEEGESIVALQDPEGAIEYFTSARDAFRRAMTSREKRLRADASYNHANSVAQIAKQTIGTGNQEAIIASFEEAVEAYEGVLERYPGHSEAQHNLDHMRYLLKRMLQQPPPEPQESQDQEEEKGEQEQQQEGGQQQESSEGQDEQQESESREQQQSEQEQEDEKEEDQQQSQQQQAAVSTTEEEEPGVREQEEMQDRQTIEAILQSLEAKDKREQQDLRTSVPDSQIRKEWW